MVMLNAETTTLRQVSSAENIANILRENIVNGIFRQGEKLNEKRLCEQFSITRTPLREAFRILQAERMLEYSPYSGVTVIKVTPRFAKELWTIRGLLESYAVEQATVNMTMEDIVYLKAIRDKFAYVDIDEFLELDAEFHMYITDMSGNIQLKKTILPVWNGACIIRNELFTVDKNRYYRSSNEHCMIIDAMLRRDPAEAKQCMTEHFNNSMIDILECAIMSLLNKQAY